jgi:hypothetical protein
MLKMICGFSECSYVPRRNDRRQRKISCNGSLDRIEVRESHCFSTSRSFSLIPVCIYRYRCPIKRFEEFPHAPNLRRRHGRPQHKISLGGNLDNPILITARPTDALFLAPLWSYCYRYLIEWFEELPNDSGSMEEMVNHNTKSLLHLLVEASDTHFTCISQVLGQFF